MRQEDRPGWVWGTVRPPLEGEEIYCAAGAGTVTALHGKTGNGSRLVEIKLSSAAKRPFFAAASNVLVSPLAAGNGVGAAVLAPADFAAADEPEPWLAGSGAGTLLL